VLARYRADRAIADPQRHSVLERSRAFLGALLRATHDRGPSALDARRQTRARAPQLLTAYLATR
jgi:hypothetical protein